MPEKKRKGTSSVSAQPTKKSKQSPASEPAPITSAKVNENLNTQTSNDAVAKARSSRKRAVDFLEEETPTASTPVQSESSKPGKKIKKSAASDTAVSSKGKKVKIGADSTNEAAEGNNKAAHKTMTAAENGNASGEDDEDVSEDEDQGVALLAGFDSDGDDPAEDQGDMSKPQPIPHSKKTLKKLKEAQENGDDGPGTVYVGRVPHGFYEQQMRDYFTQFGEITKLRLSRNKRTGASKHFAFIEFASNEVAKIVAETMDNYLMFGHILKCKYAPSENLHPDVWKGANKKYRKIPYEKLQRQHLEAPKTEEQWTKKHEKERKKRYRQVEKMKAIGYEYVVPDLKNPSDVIEERKTKQIEPASTKAIANEEEPNTIIPPANVPADEIALKKEKEKEKSTKKSKKNKYSDTVDLLTVGNLDAKNAGPHAESAKIAQNREDKMNNIDSVDINPAVAEAAAMDRKTRRGKKAGGTSVLTTASSHGDLDHLSSIPVGTEAAPSVATDDPLTRVSSEGLDTIEGVADAVLKGRKIDRKKARPAKKSSKKDKDKDKEKVAGIAPAAVSSGEKKEKAEKKRK